MDLARDLTDGFAADWVTEGWARVDGKWIELGHSAQVTVGSPDSPPIPPELAIHDVADKLNELEEKLQSVYWQYQKLVAESRQQPWSQKFLAQNAEEMKTVESLRPDATTASEPPDSGVAIKKEE